MSKGKKRRRSRDREIADMRKILRRLNEKVESMLETQQAALSKKGDVQNNSSKNNVPNNSQSGSSTDPNNDPVDPIANSEGLDPQTIDQADSTEVIPEVITLDKELDQIPISTIPLTALSYSEQGADTSTGGTAYPSFREALKKSYERRGLPEENWNIMIASLSESTIRQYNSSFKNWWNFCKNLGLDPLNPDVKDVLRFLSARFEQGVAYSTLNAERSAITLLNSINLSNDPSIARFFKLVYKPRPIKRKSWSSERVLKWAEKLEPLGSLGLKYLTFKLVSLLALATAHKVQTLSLIKLSNITILKSGVIIVIRDHINTSHVGQAQPPFILPFLSSRKAICVASVLISYIKRTKDLRGETDNLFITLKKPYHEATPQSVSHWIKLCLTSAGIGKRFTAHSERHATTSAAKIKGIDVNIIKSTAGWSEKSKAFAKFYERLID